MAKTSYLDISPELEEKYYSPLQSADRFIIPRMRNKTVILSQKKRTALTARSYLEQIKNLWVAFTDQQKADWKSADQHPQKHGWRTFVADQSQRINLGLEGVATPNQYHQDLVGKILIEAPAEEIKLIQPHPSSYWVYQKVTGKKEMYEPVEISESFSLPLKLTISYKSDLTSTGAGSFARFYASIRYLYQGQNLDYDLIIDIPLSSNWEQQTITLNQAYYYGIREYGTLSYGQEIIGQAISYNLYIHLYKVTGTLLFDNVKAEHSGSNWARDTYCEKIEQDFTRAFYQIPKNWGAITMPNGAGYLSVYPT